MAVMPSYLIVARVADPDPEGPHIEVRLGLANEPGDVERDMALDAAAELYVNNFGREPERGASVVLPWVADLDGDDE